MNSVKKQINFEESKYCMEIFGYDFIIDEEMKTYIIEVNTNPCIEESSELLKSLIPRMLGITKIEVDDAFKLTLDRLFPSRNK